MKIHKSKFLLTLILVASSLSGKGQPKRITPLHTFFQNNFDSTIIFYPWAVQDGTPAYYIVAKKDTSICFFTYLKPYNNVRLRDYPRMLGIKFINEQVKFESILPDTNRYFNPIPVDYSLKRKYWDAVNANDIWNVTDTGSVEKLANNYALDSNEDTYYLLANGKISIISFYDADRQMWIDKSIDRQKAHETKKVMLKIFINQGCTSCHL